MYLAISIAFGVAGCAEALFQARRAYKLQRTLDSTEEQLLAFEKTSKSMEAALAVAENTRVALVSKADKLSKSLRDGENASCTLRRMHQETLADLSLERDEHALATKQLHEARAALEDLKRERHALETALISEREKAEHWEEEFLREQAFRLSTEGRIMREVNNLLRYDGTGKGQEDLNDE